MTVVARAVGVALAVAASAAGVAVSNLEMVVAPPDESLVRLSWRATATPTEHCRVPTPEELAATPLHMRRAEICEGRLPSFHLRVSIDGATRVDRELRPAGAREDRPIYVLEALTVPPGAHELAVEFAAVGESDARPLVLETEIHPGPREVILVTRDELGALVLR